MAILKRLFSALFFIPIMLIAQPDTGSVQIRMDVLESADINQNVLKGKETITSASRIPTELQDIPFTAIIITEEQIEKRGYNTLVDVLKDLPGIRVSQPGSALHGETFLSRGMFGNYYVKILVDDLPVQPSVSSGMPIADQLPVTQAERIEVLYGPAAAAYGADAMAGVINIKTKKAKNVSFTDADLSVGIPGNYRLDATLGGRFGKKNRVWNYQFYGGINHYNNLPVAGGEYDDVYNPSEYVPDGDEQIYLNSPYYEGTETLPTFTQLPLQSEKFGMRIGHKKLALGFDFGRREIHSAIGSNPLYRTYHDPNTTFGDQLIRLFGSYRFSFGQWSSISNAQVLTYRIEPASNYITIDNPTTFEGKFYTYGASQDAYFEQFFTREIGNNWQFLTGLTFQFSSNFSQFDYFVEPFQTEDFSFFNNSAPDEYAFLDSLSVGPRNFYNIGALVDASYEGKKWNFTMGLRADQREFFGLVFSPRVGAVYKLNNKNRLRLTSSTAFRPPTTYFITNGVVYAEDSDTAIGVPYGNQDLKAERLINIDGGWWYQINSRNQLDVSAFFHETRNHITKSSSVIDIRGETVDYYGFVNDENSLSRLFGVQVKYMSQFSLGQVNVHSAFSALYTSGSEVLPFDRGTINQYRSQPNIMAKWLLEFYFLEHWRFMLRTHGFGEFITRSVVAEGLEDELTVPASYVMDAQLAYSFNTDMEVYVMVNNLTNSHFYGIGATGGAGLLGTRVVFQDLMANPQLLRIIKVGARIHL